MSPILADGDLVAVAALRVRTNDIAIVRSGSGFLIKRIASTGDTWVTLKSDNSETVSVFCHRRVERSKIVGRVIARFNRQKGLTGLFWDRFHREVPEPIHN